MIKPPELELQAPVKLHNDIISSTEKVWAVLSGAYLGNLDLIRDLSQACAQLLYAQYNYTPPIHFAVREGHTQIVEFLLSRGAYDPSYRIYPFNESLEVIALDRGNDEIAGMLKDYATHPERQELGGDSGQILYPRSDTEREFEKAVYDEDEDKTRTLLKHHPEYALDETYFWGEGILLFAAKENNRRMMDLLMSYGARVPNILKWTQFYYFENIEAARYLMEKGMRPDTMSWQHVTILHDMAQKGYVDKAELLLNYEADINPVDDEYQSTPLGLACRWKHIEMVDFLLKRGADPNISGAHWSTPMNWAKRNKDEQIINKLVNAGATI
jgi:uncharacterized protein